MDWSAVALLIAEQAGLPAVVLGQNAELLLIAPAAGQALGWHASSIGANCIERYVEPSAAANARWLFDKALKGALRQLELDVITSQGPALAHFLASATGEGTERGLVLILKNLEPARLGVPDGDYDYELQELRSFRLFRVWSTGRVSHVMDARCHEVLHARASPCDHCPFLRSSSPEASTVAVSAHASGDYLLTVARLAAGKPHVSVRRLPPASIASLMRTRLDEVAIRAGLSPRERAVFDQLMDGRALDDIADELEISPRTVKFHQANVLQKLGADSRSDLLRLVL